VTRQDLVELAALLGPLRRLLVLIGYDVDGLYVQLQPGGDWAHLDLLEAEARGVESGVGPPVPTLALGPTLALPLVPFLDTSQPAVPMAVPLPPALDGWTADLQSGFLQVSVLDASDGAEPLPSQFFDPVEGVTGAILSQMADALSGATLAPTGGAGLLWLVNADHWWADPGAMRASRHVREMEANAGIARDVVAGSLGEAGAPLHNFLTEQVTGEATPRPDPPLPFLGQRRRPPTLKQLLRWAPDGRARAPRRADAFFTNLGEWLRERQQEALLREGELDELRDAPWFQVLATLVDRAILTPPALAVAGSGADAGASPVVAERVDSHTVELTVRAQLTIRVTLVRDATGVEVSAEEPSGADRSLLDPIREFTWDYLTPPEPGLLPVLVIVAAPGVDVQVPRAPAPAGWTLQIIRVQDAALVPAWGTAVTPAMLLAPYVIGPSDTLGAEITLPGQPPAAPVTQVSPRPDGVSLVYPVYPESAGAQLVAVNVTLGPEALVSGHERFAFDVVYYHDTRGPPLPDPTAHVCVWATAGVTVEVVTTALTELRDYRLETEVWRVRDYQDVLAFGSSLPFDTGALEGFERFAEGWEPAWTSDEGGSPGQRLDVETTRIGVTEWFAMVVDLVVGQIPLVGDVVDVADFFQALASGTDKWGQPVTRLDLILMGGGALLPFVSGSMLEGMGRVVEGLTRALPPAAPLRAAARAAPAVTRAAPVGFDTLVQRALRPKGLRPNETEDLASRARQWGHLPQADRTAVTSALQELALNFAREFGVGVAGQFLVLDDLLDRTGAGFRIPELMREYGRWRAELLRASAGGPAPELGVEAFVTGTRSRRARAILQALLGNDMVGSNRRKARRGARARVSWKSTADIVCRRPPSRQLLLDWMGTGDLAAEVRHILARRLPEERLNGPPLWTDQTYLAPSTVTRGSEADYVRRVAQLLAGGLDPVLGPIKSFYPLELAQLLVRALDLVEHDLHRAGRTLADVLPPGEVARRIEGIEGFVRALVTGKGYEHGARYEVLMAAMQVAGVRNAFVRMGALLPGVTTDTLREGPDLLRYIGRAATRADILQGKAYSSLGPLLSTVPPARYARGGKWRGPEVFRQTISDLQRMANQSPPFMLESLEGTGQVRFSGKFEIYIDRQYYLTSPVPPSKTLTASYINRVAGWSNATILDRLTVDEILAVLDHLKGVKAPEDIDELLEASVLPAVRAQIQEFLDDPGLASQLGITIPPGMKFSFEVKLE
jgi:hypothetical protein